MKKLFINKFFGVLFLSGVFLFVNVVVAQTEINAGFVNGIWYSKMPFFAGDEVRIYAVIQNQSGFDIIGSVQFFDGDKLLNKSDFSVVSGRLTEKWADWKVIRGKRNIVVKISDVKKVEIGKSPETVNLIENIFISEKYIVDIDTDKDGVGDQKDLDDDGDGVSDAEEIKKGSDPLVFNPPIIQTKKSAEKIDNDTDILSGENMKIAQSVLTDTAKTAVEISSEILDSSQKLSSKIKVYLQDKKEKVDEKIEQEEEEEKIREKLFGAKNDDAKTDIQNTMTASILDSLPELKEIYSFFLAIIIYILESLWILAGVICLLLWLIWRVFKRRLNLREF